MSSYLSFINILSASCALFITTAAQAQYTGTGSITQGRATTTVPVVFQCTGGRPTALGMSESADGSTWTVPAEVQFQNAGFPFASDLYNSCTDATYRSTAEAIGHLDGSEIVTIDPDGELITGLVFADNYFELYINGMAVGKDRVPFTPFNSSIVRFKVRRPFTIAMLLVDWEENLGLGSENNNGVNYHPGDGGMVALFRDANGGVVAITDGTWKAQTLYTAPIKDLSCVTEVGQLRSSSTCDMVGVNDGASFFALHWPVPPMWMETTFDDSMWPYAKTYTNAEIGINNKPAYTNFTDAFDDPGNDAQFIWSSNVILDNAVIVRFTVDAPTSVSDDRSFNGITATQVYAINGVLLAEYVGSVREVLEQLEAGLYILRTTLHDGSVRCQIMIRQ